jgi:CTD small phosphatase-like protein 2
LELEGNDLNSPTNPGGCSEDNLSFFDDIHLEYVESSQNFGGNYHNYVYKTLKSMIDLRKFNYESILEEKCLLLPEKHNFNKKTLILDLDETLVHADFDNNYKNHDHVISFNYAGNEIYVPIFIRPGLFQFLSSLSKIFEIFVFTASKKEYADSVLNFLDPESKFIKHRFYREHCICIKNKFYIKDLRIFLNRKIENIILVDNSLYSFTNQLLNGVLINSFYNDREDRELLNLQSYLQTYLFNVNDVREINEKIFNFKTIMEELCSS